MMKKRILAFMLTACILLSSAAVPVGAVKEDYEAVSQGIKEVQSEYVPEQTYFVAKSAQRNPGEYTNMDGDKTQNCEVKSIQNAHGKFEGIVRSGGFAKYVFAQVFGDVPSYDYHCNTSSLSDNVTVVARYATECNRKNSLIRGEIDGTVTVENVKALIGLASVGDILVLAPVKNCNSNGTSMIITDINEAGITAYQADYTGKCAVTQNLFTFDALAEYHCLSLLHSNNYPVEEPIPPEAVSNISLSETDFALNENITANWSAVKKADGYKAYLINLDNDNTVVLDASQCVASFTFKEPGNYKIGVSAVNEYGESEISYSKKIVVHNYNYVTFVDFEGNVISKQAVEYGSNAKDPGKPQRRGYTFDSWDHELKNITEPLTISPVYEINYYNVQFCGVDGKQIGRVQSVPFGGEATPPDEYNITEFSLYPLAEKQLLPMSTTLQSRAMCLQDGRLYLMMLISGPTTQMLKVI